MGTDIEGLVECRKRTTEGMTWEKVMDLSLKYVLY